MLLHFSKFDYLDLPLTIGLISALKTYNTVGILFHEVTTLEVVLLRRYALAGSLKHIQLT